MTDNIETWTTAMPRASRARKPKTLRALIVIRLSRVTEATTSPERQLKECVALCAGRGYDVVGVAEDLDISGSTDPMKRPNLGRWLRGEYNEHATPGTDNREPTPFDVIVVWRVDRLVRSVRFLQDAVNHARDHGRVIVSATEAHFDMTSPFAELMIAMIGMAAQLELDAIRDRNAGAFQHNYAAGKWRGGVPPWGYLPAKDAATGEWRLYQDPEQVRLIREAFERCVNGEALNRIARDFTERGELTPRDRFAQHQGRETKGFAWAMSPLSRALASQTMLGYAVAREFEVDPVTGKPVRDASGKKIYGEEQPVRNPDGSPVVRAEPIFTPAELEQVRKAMSGHVLKGKPAERENNMLLHVIFCGVCGEPCWRLKGGPGRKPKYRCASANRPASRRCSNRSIDLATADELVSDQVLALLGESERLERKWNPGNDIQAELDEVNAQLVDLTGFLASPAYRPGTPQRRALDENIRALADRQMKLEQQPRVPARWEYTGTGERFSDWWERQDTTGRNVWLRRMDVRLKFTMRALPNGRNELVSADVEMGKVLEMVEHLRPVGAAEAVNYLLTHAKEAGIQGMEIQETGMTITGTDGNTYTVDEFMRRFGLPSDRI